MSRTSPPLAMSARVREVISRVADDPLTLQRDVTRARVLLAAADGISNASNAREHGVSVNTVVSWRRSFLEDGLATLGLVRPGRGRRGTIPGLTLSRVMHAIERNDRAKDPLPAYELAVRLGVSDFTLRRVRRDLGLVRGSDGQLELPPPPLTPHHLEVCGLHVGLSGVALAVSVDPTSRSRIVSAWEPGEVWPAPGRGEPDGAGPSGQEPVGVSGPAGGTSAAGTSTADPVGDEFAAPGSAAGSAAATAAVPEVHFDDARRLRAGLIVLMATLGTLTAAALDAVGGEESTVGSAGGTVGAEQDREQDVEQDAVRAFLEIVDARVPRALDLVVVHAGLGHCPRTAREVQVLEVAAQDWVSEVRRVLTQAGSQIARRHRFSCLPHLMRQVQTHLTDHAPAVKDFEWVASRDQLIAGALHSQLDLLERTEIF